MKQLQAIAMRSRDIECFCRDASLNDNMRTIPTYITKIHDDQSSFNASVHFVVSFAGISLFFSEYTKHCGVLDDPAISTLRASQSRF